MSVGYIKQTNYEHKQLKSALARGMEIFGGMKAILNGRKNILLKPNFVRVESVQDGALTHPVFILAIAELLADYGCDVSVGDSPGFGSLSACIRKLRLERAFKSRNIKLCPFTTPKKIAGIVSKEKHADSVFSELVIAAELDQFDGVINLPKLKTHCQFGFTGAVKNLYGCVPGKRKAWMHMTSGNNAELFAEMILRIAEAVSPFFHIADGILSLHKHGPTKGEPFPLHAILLGENPLELDWFFCDLIHFEQRQSPLFRVAKMDSDFEKLGDQPEYRSDFVHSNRIDLRFNPFQVVRSVLQHQFVNLRERLPFT